MLLDDNIADLSLETCRTATKVKDELALVKLNLFTIVLGHNADELENVLTILEGEVTSVAKSIGIIGDIGILIDLDGATA